MVTLMVENTCLLLFIISLILCSGDIPNPTGNNFTICHWNTRIVDPQRSSHNIPLKTHYPCDTSNIYPIMVFGHASTSSNTWYDYVWQALVPQGYIITMPGSYEVLNDSHKLFAADMAYTLQYFFDDCNITKSCPLYGRIMNKSMVSGHSLGGAASLLIAGNAINVDETFKYQYTSMMTLSGCGVDSVATNYTYAAQHINIASLLLTGSSDCMCNPPYNVSIVGYYTYDIPDTTCKYLAVITNATHCHFSDEWSVEDDACSIIEETDCIIGPHPDHPQRLKRERQWQIVNTYYALFMYQTLYANNNQNSIQAVKNQLTNDENNEVMFDIGINC